MKSILVRSLLVSSFAFVSLPVSVWATPDDPSSAGMLPTVEPPAEPNTIGAAPARIAKPTRAENSIFLEGLGAGLVYSLNYERLAAEDVGVRIGFSYMSFSASATSGGDTSSAKATFMTFPLEVSYLGIGSPRHIFEVGGGLSVLYATGSAKGTGYSASGSGTGFLPNVLMGYRLQPVDGAGFHLRVGMMIFFGKGLGFDVTDPDKVGYLPWPYLSMGAAF